MPENRRPPDPELYNAVKGTSSTTLTNAVEKVDGITAEDEEALERGGKLALRGTKRRIARWSLWFVFFLCSAGSLAVVVGVGYLAYAYVIQIVAQGEAGQTLSAIIGFVLGIATTLAVEFLWHLNTTPKHDK